MKKKISSLQTLRLLASLGVFHYHLWDNYLGVTFLSPGTDLFFILVGFVAAMSQSQRIHDGKWMRYIWGRYLRLYVMFIPIFLVYIVAGRDELSPEFVLKSFFLFPIPDHLPLVGPTWMLSLFLVFYWLFSLAFLFRSERVLYSIFIFWTLGCVYYSWLGWRPAIAPEWFRIIFDIRNVEFIFGYLAGKLAMNAKIKMNYRFSIWSLIAGSMALIASIVWYNGITHEVESNIRIFLYGLPIAMITFGLTCLEQLNNENAVIKVITYKPLVALGDTSYVIFLIHNVILRVWDEIIPITAIQEPLIIMVVLVAAIIIYRFWEKPVLNYFRARTLRVKPLISQV